MSFLRAGRGIPDEFNTLLIRDAERTEKEGEERGLGRRKGSVCE